MIDTDEIRKDVAMKYGFVLGKDDPALVSLTILNSILDQHVNTLNAQQEANLKSLINSIQKSHEETKRLAKKVVDEGTEYACDQVSTAIRVTIQESREDFRQEMSKVWEVIQAAKKTAVISAVVSTSCALFTVGVVVANVL